MKKVVTSRTAPKKGQPQVITAVTLDFTGVTVEELIEPSIDSLIINLQSGWRKKGIPAQVEVKVKDLIARMGTRSGAPLTVDGIVAVSTTLDAAQQDALIADLLEKQKARNKAAKSEQKPQSGKPKKDGDRPQA